MDHDYDEEERVDYGSASRRRQQQDSRALNAIQELGPRGLSLQRCPHLRTTALQRARLPVTLPNARKCATLPRDKIAALCQWGCFLSRYSTLRKKRKIQKSRSADSTHATNESKKEKKRCYHISILSGRTSTISKPSTIHLRVPVQPRNLATNTPPVASSVHINPGKHFALAVLFALSTSRSISRNARFYCYLIREHDFNCDVTQRWKIF